MMAPAAALPIAELLPHGAGMILIDRLISSTAAHAEAVVVVRRDSRFFERTGVPAWVGIEYMAQTVAAHAGYTARREGRAPAIGFLLGTRSYECRVAEFPLGAELRVVAEPLVAERGLRSFRCAIEHGERVAAEAVINVYEPAAGELTRLRAEEA
jgi:predicted hotdog family 3-hydroxylacyl-ACP dehydratase